MGPIDEQSEHPEDLVDAPPGVPPGSERPPRGDDERTADAARAAPWIDDVDD